MKLKNLNFGIRESQVFYHIFSAFIDTLQILNSAIKLISKKKLSKYQTICVGNIYVGGTGKPS